MHEFILLNNEEKQDILNDKLCPQTLLAFSTAGLNADATTPMVDKVAITKFLFLSYSRPLRTPNSSPVSQITHMIRMLIKMNGIDGSQLVQKSSESHSVPVPVG